eukprot:4397200-Prymnesium_polylepis.3
MLRVSVILPGVRRCVEFFVYVGLSLLALQPVLLAARYWSADYVPKIIGVAMTHSAAPSIVLRRVYSLAGDRGVLGSIACGTFDTTLTPLETGAAMHRRSRGN